MDSGLSYVTTGFRGQ